jgi:hypothetical protein
LKVSQDRHMREVRKRMAEHIAYGPTEDHSLEARQARATGTSASSSLPPGDDVSMPCVDIVMADPMILHKLTVPNLEDSFTKEDARKRSAASSKDSPPVRSKDAPEAPPAHLLPIHFVKAEADSVSPKKEEIIKAIRKAAIDLEGTMENEDPDEQVQRYDNLFQNRIRCHGTWVKDLLTLDELVRSDILPILERLSGISYARSVLGNTGQYSFRNLPITMVTLAKIRQLSLEQRIAVADLAKTTSDTVRSNPDHEIGCLIRDLCTLTSKNIPPPIGVFFDIVKKNLSGPCALVKQVGNSDRYSLTDPPFPGHTVGRDQARTAASLPKALLTAVIKLSLEDNLNIDDWLLHAGTSLKQQHATMQMRSLLRTEGIKKSRPGIGALPPGESPGSSYQCRNCAAASPSIASQKCKACQHQGFPVPATKHPLLTMGARRRGLDGGRRQRWSGWHDRHLRGRRKCTR